MPGPDFDPVEAFAFAQRLVDLSIVTLISQDSVLGDLTRRLARGAPEVKAFLDPFALEVALKALLRVVTGEAVQGHDLVALLDRLGTDVERELEQAWASLDEPSSSVPCLRDLIAAHNRDFIDRRYPYERGDLAAPDDLGSAIDAIRRVFATRLDAPQLFRFAELLGQS